MKILSLNCNGIRSATNKGLESFIEENQFDILCFQEIKALPTDINLDFYEKLKFTPIIFPAEKKGYSGTAVFSKIKFKQFDMGLGEGLLPEEGRLILVQFESFSLINSYFPSGTSGEERQAIKIKFLNEFESYINTQNIINQKTILTGDINIAHRAIDIHDPIRNKNSSGFLPIEREFIDRFLDLGWVDCFRFKNGDIKDSYSWWTYRSGARNKNKGWRIDYFFVTERFKKNIVNCSIYSNIILSDHAPIVLEIL